MRIIPNPKTWIRFTRVHINALITCLMLAILDGMIIWKMDLVDLTMEEIGLIGGPIAAIGWVARQFAGDAEDGPERANGNGNGNGNS